VNENPGQTIRPGTDPGCAGSVTKEWLAGKDISRLFDTSRYLGVPHICVLPQMQ
jgi:hypothetical protein